MKKLFSLIRKCNLNPVIETFRFALLCIPFACLIFITIAKNLQSIFIGYSIGFILVGGFIYFSRYWSILCRKQQNLQNEFIDVFTYFGIYIRNGYNVYQSLIQIKQFCNEDLLDLVNKLIYQIDDDKSIKPYADFGSEFENVSIKEVALSIYQMVDEGGGENYIRQYESLFAKLADLRYEAKIENNKNKLGKLTILPLIGSGIVMMVLTISLVSVMGNMFNGF